MIRVSGIKSGKSGKNIVNQIIFIVDRDKIVCHLYNNTCLILVNGHGYQCFIDTFLKPFFDAKLQAHSQRIQSVNDETIDKFGPRTVKRADVKFKKGYSFPSKYCDYALKA